ncbi:MAG: alginate lyase family protein [Lentisphaeria bacterium]|nr:alginate lyase family protein [Lentisphaeria bacterium]
MNKKFISGILLFFTVINIFAMENINSKKFKQYFFNSLKPEAMPSGYSEAFKKNDYRKALKIAVDYFRKRPTPALLSDLKDREYDMNVAERAVKGNITQVSIPYQFPGGKIDFEYDPTRAKGVFNPEWQWQLNRMNFWNHMALAYYNSRDEKFAAAFDKQLKSWVTTVRCPKNWNGIGSAWRTIETGLRLMGSWQIAFEVFRKSPSVSDETLALMLASMQEQAWHALNHRTKRNWLMMEVNGSYTFAMLFPEFKASRQIQKDSAYYLGEELRKQILPDGMHNELSPDYHGVVYHCSSMMYNIAKQQNGTAALPADFVKNIEMLADVYLKLATPGFTMPRTNDCYTTRLAPFMKTAYKLFPHRKDFLWGATSGKEGTPPAGKTASKFMPYAGFIAMRSSWRNDAAYLCFDVGPLGVAHAHNDKLNINIYKGDEELLFDDGGGEYEDSPYRIYGRSGYDHNTVLVDGKAQNRNTPRQVKKAIDADFISNEKFDYACGVYEDTFGEKMLKTAIHKREVLFVKPEFFAVVDTMTGRDGKVHDYTMLLQLDTLNVKTSGNSVRGILNGKYDLYALQLSDNTAITVKSGRTSPVSGWYVGRNDKHLHKASTVEFTVKQQKNFKFRTLFFPLLKGAAPPVAKTLGNGLWEVKFNNKVYKLDFNNLKNNL